MQKEPERTAGWTLQTHQQQTKGCQLGHAETHKLVYVAIYQHKEQRISNFTKQYGWDVHRTWAKAGLAPELESPSPIPANGSMSKWFTSHPMLTGSQCDFDDASQGIVEVCS